MRCASEIAQWWEQQRRESQDVLGRFVLDHPRWFSIGVATAASTNSGVGLLDVVHFDEGATQRGGYHSDDDVVQFVAVVGPTGRIVRAGLRSMPGKLAVVSTDPGGPVCTWMTASEALRHPGATLFAKVDDLAMTMGIPPGTRGGVPRLEDLLPVLRRLGARAQIMTRPGTLEDVYATARQHDGVVAFGVKWAVADRTVGHALYAFKDVLGRVRIADRTGRVVETLAQLNSMYPGIAQAVVSRHTMLLIEHARMLPTPSGLSALCLGVTRAVAVNDDIVTAQEIIDAFKEYTAAQDLPLSRARPPTPPTSTYIVRRGDTLSQIARHHYGDRSRWREIYRVNRGLIGSRPDLLRPGQRLQLPADAMA